MKEGRRACRAQFRTSRNAQRAFRASSGLFEHGMPAGLRNAQVNNYSACRSAFSSFWLTTFVTPSACMDTPNSISAISMVRR